MVNTHKKNARTKASLTTGSSKMAVNSLGFKPFYASTNDPRIETDIVALESSVRILPKVFDFDQKAVRPGLSLNRTGEYEALCADISGTKPLMYLYYCKTLDGTNRVVPR